MLAQIPSRLPYPPPWSTDGLSCTQSKCVQAIERARKVRGSRAVAINQKHLITIVRLLQGLKGTQLVEVGYLENANSDTWVGTNSGTNLQTMHVLGIAAD